MSDAIAETKYGRWRVTERALPQVKELAKILSVSFERAVEICIQETPQGENPQ